MGGERGAQGTSRPKATPTDVTEMWFLLDDRWGRPTLGAQFAFFAFAGVTPRPGRQIKLSAATRPGARPPLNPTSEVLHRHEKQDQQTRRPRVARSSQVQGRTVHRPTAASIGRCN